MIRLDGPLLVYGATVIHGMVYQAAGIVVPGDVAGQHVRTLYRPGGDSGCGVIEDIVVSRDGLLCRMHGDPFLREDAQQGCLMTFLPAFDIQGSRMHGDGGMVATRAMLRSVILSYQPYAGILSATVS